MPVGLDFSMHFMDEKRNTTDIHSEAPMKTPVHPGNSALRRAIRRNIVTFPAQIPVLLKQPPAEVQWRVVLLYFVRGWTSPKIATRCNIPIHQVSEILKEWTVRALALGYVQIIDAEAFATCCRIDIEGRSHRDTDETRLAAFSRIDGTDSSPFPQAAPVVVAQISQVSETTPAEDMAVDCSERNIDLIGALDVAIEHCEEWRDEFWMRAATLLRDMRIALAVALELRRSTGPADRLVNALPNAEHDVQPGPGISKEEQVSHAVA
jgi:hypothetical protein